MAGEARSLGLGEITTIHEMKTASMIVAAAKLGVLAGGGSDEQLEAAGRYGAAVGLAFQIRDDMLDLTSSEAKLGKSTSDAESKKSTFATLLGPEACGILVAKKTEEAKEAVRESFENTQFFYWLADFLAERDS
jgi:geranylgeranyl diphosphate synthase type II